MLPVPFGLDAGNDWSVRGGGNEADALRLGGNVMLTLLLGNFRPENKGGHHECLPEEHNENNV